MTTLPYGLAKRPMRLTSCELKYIRLDVCLQAKMLYSPAFECLGPHPLKRGNRGIQTSNDARGWNAWESSKQQAFSQPKPQLNALLYLRYYTVKLFFELNGVRGIIDTTDAASSATSMNPLDERRRKSTMKITVTSTPSQDDLVNAVKQAGLSAQYYAKSEGVFYNKEIRLGYLSSVCHEIADGHCQFGGLSLSQNFLVELCPDSTLQIAALDGDLLWSLSEFDEKKARILLDCGVPFQALSSFIRIEL